jgi:hypothetical protein
MSTVLEIKEAIERLSPEQRAELESLLWPGMDTPPNVKAKLQEASKGRFLPGDRSNITRILQTLQ